MFSAADPACQNPVGRSTVEAGSPTRVPGPPTIPEAESLANTLGPATIEGGAPANTPLNGCSVNIRGEIDRGFLSGKYSLLPLIQRIGPSPSRNGMAIVEIQNGTAYALTALFSGPIDRYV
jgi:hypothetical protein